MSSIMKGIVDEAEDLAVVYIDGKPSVKYANNQEALADVKRLRNKFPDKKIEINYEVREDDDLEELDENLRKWFKEKWVRFGPDGKIRGACARGSDKEGKPKCLPQKKAHALGKKGRKYAASKKRREDPNPERRGPAKNVATKKKTNESMNEDVGGNYLYHATGGLKSILQSGYVDPAGTPQDATYAQTNRPTVSLTRDWGYASGSNAPEMTGGIARHAILVFDRSRIENNFKTLATSQSWETRGTAFPDPGNLKAGQQARSYDVDGDGTLTSKDADEVFRRQMMTKPDGTPMSRQEVGQKMGRLKVAFYSPKAGHEFEEAVVVSKKGLPIKGTMIGFWVNPKSDLTKDPEVMNNPLRLEKTGPNKFVKASEKVMNEEKCPHCGGELVSEEMMNEKQDACYRKVKARYKVWPSAYASGALVQCRKKGAANWGNKSNKNESNIMKGLVDEAPIKIKSHGPGDPIEIPDEYKDINIKTKIQGEPKEKQTNFEVWGNDHGYYVFGNNTNAVLSAWPNGEMMFLTDPRDPKGRENCMRFAKQAMKPVELKSLSGPLRHKILQNMSSIDQPLKEGVIVSHDAKDPEVAILGGAGTYKLSNIKKKAQMEANELAKDVMDGKFKNSAINVKQLANTLNTIVAAEDEMEKGYFGEDTDMRYAAEKTPEVNPYGGQRNRQFRGAIAEALLSEMPTDNPTGSSGEGGWRKYSPKPAGELDEDTAYAGGMGQGGYAGQSYRKFKPKSAGTFNEDVSWADRRKVMNMLHVYYDTLGMDFWDWFNEPGNKEFFAKRAEVTPEIAYDVVDSMDWGQHPQQDDDYEDDEEQRVNEACWKGYHKEGNKKMFGKTYPNCVKNTNEEQLDEISDETLLKYAEKASDARLHKKLPTKKVDNRYAGVTKALSKVSNEEQLDEKCWDSHKQVGMKKKGSKMVPNCVPKESAIMKGLTGKRS